MRAEPIRFDLDAGAYLDCRVKRGFPLGGIGAGNVCINTDGSFGELRSNNNWMCPVRGLRGSFFAVFAQLGEARETVVLRRPPPPDAPPEYAGAHDVESTTFVGLLPSFSLRFQHHLPIGILLDGFTPHVPHDVASSTLPVAVLRFHLENPDDDPVAAAVLFSFENVLGRGGTGHLGVDLGPGGELVGVHQRVVYDSVAGNFQEAVTVAGRQGVRFRTEQTYDERDHRRSVTGQYLMLVESDEDLEVTVCDAWNADAERSSALDAFARDGRVACDESGRRGEDGVYRPAAACAARCVLEPRSNREVVFLLGWWTADHVTEPALARRSAASPDAATGAVAHDGVRVGHVYEVHHRSLDEAAARVLDERASLEERSGEVDRLLGGSTLPPWLVRALANARDSAVCNGVVPQSGRLYTIEGVDWSWPMGGLTGTNDQRLAAQPYVATFFPALNLTELDEFRRLQDARGAVPHGNGNCDLGLGTTDVPYGWPTYIKDFLPAKEWTDLTMSLVLQVGKVWRSTGRADVLDRFWPALVRGMDYLAGLAPHGVPEGGTTYDVWDFPGIFAYSATLYLASLETMIDLATAVDQARITDYRKRLAIAARRVEDLWDERGFYRTTPAHETIFTASLAGEWAARYAGLPPVVPHERCLSHLRHQQRVLVDAAIEACGGRFRPLPRAEALFDGTEVVHRLGRGLPKEEALTYVWQVISYQACLQIYVGEVEPALRTLRAIYERIWREGNAWSAGLRGNDESIYMTHGVLWAVLDALTGAALDVPRRTLHLGPRVGGEIGRLRCPFFLPGVWAMLDYDEDDKHVTVTVLRHFGEPAVIDTAVTHAPSGTVRTHALQPTELAEGTTLELDLERGKKGR
ncbi:MAG: GH116 family glycosyl-hydrolase [Thermodesulfobacteriota bacterium]